MFWYLEGADYDDDHHQDAEEEAECQPGAHPPSLGGDRWGHGGPTAHLRLAPSPWNTPEVRSTPSDLGIILDLNQ